MKIIPLHPEHFKTIANHLKKGFPAIFPTDTTYGFSGDIFSERAVKMVEKVKGRKEKPFLLLVASFLEMQKWGNTQFLTQELQQQAEQKPISFLLPKTDKIPKKFFPQTQEIGIRVPIYPPLLGFLTFYGNPIFSTSANRSTCPPLSTSKEIVEEFGNVENLLFVDAGDLPENAVSSIFRPIANGYEILRS